MSVKHRSIHTGRNKPQIMNDEHLDDPNKVTSAIKIHL